VQRLVCHYFAALHDSHGRYCLAVLEDFSFGERILTMLVLSLGE
jgi:hypothetical protein